MASLITTLILLILGYIFGQIAERRHYRSIRQREIRFRQLLLFNEKRIPREMVSAALDTTLVTGSVVVSVDYCKRFLAGVRMLIGGRMRSYETLLERARREAILRMKEGAKKQGATMIFNVRIETSSISQGRRKTIGSVEVLAYGTAVIQRTRQSY